MEKELCGEKEKFSKKIFLKIFILVASFGLGFFAFSAEAQAATTFYVAVDDSSDDYDGTSPDRAWKSIAKVNSQTFDPGDSILFQRGDVWRERLKIPSSGAPGMPVTFGAYGTGGKPLLLGSVTKNNPGDWTNIGTNLWATVDNSFSYEVGLMILGPDATASVGAKFWTMPELGAERDFWYDASKKRVVVYSGQNPAEKYSPIEITNSKGAGDFLIFIGSKRYIHIKDLALKYIDTPAIKIADTQGIEIRNCDIGFVGGAQLGTGKDQFGNIVENRFGNAVAIWNGAHDIIVDGCRIWQVFDAGVTFQAANAGIDQYNIYFTNNIIWYTEYSFELFNYGAGSRWWNNHFEGNVCIGAGYGWGHDRRSDLSDPARGFHIMATDSVSSVDGLYLTNNVYYESKKNIMWNQISGMKNLVIDNNYYYQTSGDMIDFLRKKYPMSQFPAYQSYFKQDLNSIAGDKRLLKNAARSKVSPEDIPLINKLFQEVDGDCQGKICLNCEDGDGDGYGAIGTDLSGCSASTTAEDCDDDNPEINADCSLVYADVNNDAHVNIKDIQICIKGIIDQNSIPSEQIQKCQAVAMPDTVVNIKDIQAIIQAIVNQS